MWQRSRPCGTAVAHATPQSSMRHRNRLATRATSPGARGPQSPHRKRASPKARPFLVLNRSLPKLLGGLEQERRGPAVRHGVDHAGANAARLEIELGHGHAPHYRSFCWKSMPYPYVQFGDAAYSASPATIPMSAAKLPMDARLFRRSKRQTSIGNPRVAPQSPIRHRNPHVAPQSPM